MAVSFAANSVTLANWGFSAGDIATLAGAGRAIGTWVTAQIKDQNLLDFMRVDPEDLIPRKGIIDPIVLHKRWDISLTLLQNGRKRVIKNHNTPLVENMSRFSWFMTLVISVLDSAIRLADFRKVTRRLVERLFSEHIDSLDYPLRELPHHIQGWMSSACVRNISAKARREWNASAERGQRRHGQIPSDDCMEVERLLIWLSGACGQQQEREFETASSDVYALAAVLQAIGFDLLSTYLMENGGDESYLCVTYNPSAIVVGRPIRLQGNLEDGRRGMRIPLDFMEECVSLWPGSISENNSRRLLFKRGIEAAGSIRVDCDRYKELSYLFVAQESSKIGRVSETMLYSVVESLFPVPTSYLVEEMGRIMEKHPQWADQDIRDSLHYLATNSSCLAEVQIFVMGVYYALLKPFLDTSQLTVREAYGDWRWNDLDLLYRIQRLLEFKRRGQFLDRSSMLKLLAIFFAGAEESQCSAVNINTIGLHSKISVLSASILGHADTLGKAAKFFLFDLDATTIPSNARGMILSGEPCMSIEINTVPSEQNLCNIRDVSQDTLDEDLSSHIEPDWDNDIQACRIVYRYKGRLVRRFSPIQIEEAVLGIRSELSLEFFPPISQICVQDIESLDNNRCPVPKNDSPRDPSILFSIKGRGKARTCLQTLYFGRGFRPVTDEKRWPRLEWAGADLGTVILQNSGLRDRGFTAVVIA